MLKGRGVRARWVVSLAAMTAVVTGGADAGEQWEPELRGVQLLDAQLGRVAHFLARTSDGGATWQWVPTRTVGEMGEILKVPMLPL